MNKLLFCLFAASAAVACSTAPKSKTMVADTVQADRVEVLVFHGKQQCPTCRAIENLTREVIESDFAEQFASGTVVFRVIDIATEEALAEKYEVAWSSLYVVRHRTGTETAENLTEFAFANARNNPGEFKDVVKRKIDERLK